MILSVKNDLTNKGVDSKKIHFELFTSSSSNTSASTTTSAATSVSSENTSKVSVKIDGITYQLDLAYDGETILDAALKTGADLPFACKGGVCCTCRAKVTKGTVDMDLNFSLEDDEVEKGYILTCQSHPTSEEVFVDFDLK
jgi:ring-1,2-phenylacetyl-CoA epoxidase subunit PaaE